MQDDIALFGRQFPDRHVGQYVIVLRHRPHQLMVVPIARPPAPPGPRPDGSILQRQFGAGEHQVRVYLQLDTQSGTGRTGAVGAVEAEGARLDLRQVDTTVHAGEVLAQQLVEGLVRIGHVGDDQSAIAQLERCFYRIG